MFATRIQSLAPCKSALKVFLQDHSVLNTDDAKQRRTHNSLNGGMYEISMEENDEFLKLYALSWMLKEKMYLIELRTPTFKMHMDLDVIGESPLQLQMLQETWLPVIQDVITSFYPSVEKGSV